MESAQSVSDENGTGHVPEFVDQLDVLFFGKRRQIDEKPHQLRPVDEQKKNDQQHEKKVGQKRQGVGSDGPGLIVKKQAHRPADIRDGFVQFFTGDGDIEIGQQRVDPIQQGAVGKMRVDEAGKGRTPGQLDQFVRLLGQDPHKKDNGDKQDKENQQAGNH
jgi:hypothetical protein